VRTCRWRRRPGKQAPTCRFLTDGAYRSATSSGKCSGSPRFLRSVARPKLAQAAPVKLGTMLPWSTHSLLEQYVTSSRCSWGRSCLISIPLAAKASMVSAMGLDDWQARLRDAASCCTRSGPLLAHFHCRWQCSVAAGFLRISGIAGQRVRTLGSHALTGSWARSLGCRSRLDYSQSKRARLRLPPMSSRAYPTSGSECLTASGGFQVGVPQGGGQSTATATSTCRRSRSGV